MERQENDRRSLALFVGTMCIFGTVALFRRLIPLSSGLLACSRGALGALFLLLTGRPGGRVARGQMARLAVSGALIGFNWIVLFEAYRYTTVATASLCYYMQPVLVTLGAAALLGERLSPRKALCCAAAVAGMVLVSGAAGRGRLAGREAVGVALGLAAAALYAAVVLMNKRITGVEARTRTLVQLSAATLALLPYLALTEDFSAVTLSARTIVLVLILGVVHTGFAYALYFRSMEGLRAQTVAIFSYLDPVVTLLTSALILGERMDAAGVLGAALILGAAVVSELGT